MGMQIEERAEEREYGGRLALYTSALVVCDGFVTAVEQTLAFCEILIAYFDRVVWTNSEHVLLVTTDGKGRTTTYLVTQVTSLFCWFSASTETYLISQRKR